MTMKPSYRLQTKSIRGLSIDTARFARYFYACLAGLILLLAAQTSFAAIAYRGFAQAKSAAAAATPITSTTGSYGERTNCGNVNPSIPAGSVNDLLVAQVIARRNAAVVTMPGWNVLFTDNVAGQNYQVFLFWRKAVGGDPNTITQAGTCNHLMAYITRFGNVDTTTPLETQPLPAGNWAYADTNVVASGTQSVAVANSMLVLATFGADDGVVTQDPSFTQLYDVRDTSADDAGFSLNTRNVAATGSYGPFTNMAWSRGNDPVHGVLFAVRPSASVSLPTLTVARPPGTSTGDVMVASIAVTTASVGISAPPGWTVVQDSTQTQGGSEHLVTYVKPVANIGSEPASYAWTFSASHSGAVGGIVSYSGVATASPVVDSGARFQNGNNALNHIAPSVVATADNMLVTVHSYTSSGTWTPAGGMTERVDVFSQAATGAAGVSLEMSDQLLVAAGGTGNRTARASNNGDEGVSHALVLQPGVVPVAAYHLEEASWSGAPGEVKDVSGNGLDGRAVNGVTTASATPAVAGNPGTCGYGAFKFATPGYVLVPYDARLNGTDFTVAFWARVDGAPGQWRSPVTSRDIGTGYNVYAGTNNRWQFWTGNGGWDVLTGPVVTAAWTHIVVQFQATSGPNGSGVYTGTKTLWVDGVNVASNAAATYKPNTTEPFRIGSGGNPGAYTLYPFEGPVDEMRVYDTALSLPEITALYNETHPCSSLGLNHLEIQHASGTGLTCAASILTVKACADSAIPCLTPYTLGVSGTLSASGAPAVNWDGTTGGAAGAGFVIPNGSSVVTKNVQVATAGTVVFGITSPLPVPTGATTCNFGAPVCTFTANTAGFIFSDTATGNTYNIPPQVSGITSPTLYLRAVQASTANPAVCTPAIISQPSVSVTMGYACNNPSTCQAGNLVTVNSTPIAPGGTAVNNLPFDANGSTPITVRYDDAGRITLNATKTLTPFGGAAPVVLNGNSNAFVVAPHHFGLSAITAAPLTAGINFSATVTAYNGLPTPTATRNFGLETAPGPAEGVALGFSKCQPTGAGTSNGSFSGSLGGFGSGSATANNLNWNEVGNGDLTASLASGSYLGSGLNASGTTGTGGITCNGAGNVGRFKPDHFALIAGSIVTRSTAACVPASGFTYMGEPMQLDITLEAQSAPPGNTRTSNYAGAFAMLDPTDLLLWPNAKLGASPSIALGAIDTALPTPLSARANVVSVAATGWVVGGSEGRNTVTATAILSRAAAPDGPYNLIKLGIDPRDSDGVRLTSYDLDADNNSVNERRQIGATTAYRYGRLRLLNAYGSELLPLRVPVRVEYFNGTTWTLNAADNCTSLPVNTIVLSGGISGNTSASALVLNAGSGTVTLSKPSPVATGSVDIAANLGAAGTDASCNAASPPSTAGNRQWLQYSWCAGKLDPNARAKFGSPRAPYIYLRERY